MIQYIGLLLVFLLGTTAHAKVEFTWGMRHELEQYKIIGNQFKNEIEEMTKKEVVINLKDYTGDPKNPLEEIDEGRIQIYQVPTTMISSLVSQSEWIKAWEVPYLFKDKNHVEKYIASDHTSANLKKLETAQRLPITYSYAGGFVGVLSKAGTNNDFNFESLKFCEIADFDAAAAGKMTEGQYLSRLPCNILLYEIHELEILANSLKKQLKLDLTKHMVSARVTMVSKKHLQKIPEKYRDHFLSKLRKLLNQERQAIYAREIENLKLIQSQTEIKVSPWVRKKIIEPRLVAGDLKAEIDHINAMPEARNSFRRAQAR